MKKTKDRNEYIRSLKVGDRVAYNFYFTEGYGVQEIKRIVKEKYIILENGVKFDFDGKLISIKLQPIKRKVKKYIKSVEREIKGELDVKLFEFATKRTLKKSDLIKCIKKIKLSKLSFESLYNIFNIIQGEKWKCKN